MADIRGLFEIKIDPPKDWLDAPPLEAVPEHWGALPDDGEHDAPPLEAAPDPAPEEPHADPEALLQAAGAVIETPPRQHGRLILRTPGELMAMPARKYLLQGLFAPCELSLIWGQPKTGKSFLALRLAYGLALGMGMWGRKAPRPLRVLYIAAEGMGGMGTRLKALAELGDPGEAFMVITQAAEIGHPGSDLPSILEAVKAHRADFVVIDTLARTFGTGNEDSAQDMGRFVAACDAVREAGAHVLVVHHGAKSTVAQTPRGSGALMGACDLILQVSKGAEAAPSLCIVQACKDDEDGAGLPFRLEVVTVGEREDRTPIETCRAEEAQPAAGRKGAPKLKGQPAQAASFLNDAVVAEGQPLPKGEGFPSAIGLYGVTKSRWREECIARGISMSDDPDNARRAAERAMEAAIKAGAVACRGDLVWRVYDA
jgi:hypothetical protein